MSGKLAKALQLRLKMLTGLLTRLMNFYGTVKMKPIERVTTVIEYNDFDPLIVFVSNLQSCLRDAGNLHREFYEASREASCSCVQTAGNCNKYNEAKRDKMKTASAGSVVAGTAIGTTTGVVTHAKGNLPVRN